MTLQATLAGPGAHREGEAIEQRRRGRLEVLSWRRDGKRRGKKTRVRKIKTHRVAALKSNPQKIVKAIKPARKAFIEENGVVA
jgi:hypothetical protein